MSARSVTSVPCVLVLAGLDPSGGAGLLADAEAIRAAGARPLCVATALTLQTTAHAFSFQPVDPAFVVDCARALLAEEPVRALKLGMLGTAAMARAVAALLAEAKLPAVIDPVLAASSGAPLFRGTAADARASYAALWPGAVITPNAPEARVLLDRAQPIDGPAAQEEAARAFVDAGARAALVKGGHVPAAVESVDVLAEQGGGVSHFRGPRLRGGARGTGCRLASALAAGLAVGLPLEAAAREAKKYVFGYLRAALA
jgi:hydroxymethylpyrimidine/phosphomethylpyrimidine kinase